MQTYGVLDIQKNGVISTYEATRPKYTYPWSDRTLFFHFVIAEGQHAGGYSLNEQGNLEYDLAYEPTVQPPLQAELLRTQDRQEAGFILYQKIFADLSINSTLSSVDQTLLVYPALQTMRCLLKDGMGETALRFHVKTIVPMGLFSTEAAERYRVLTREYCQEFRPAQYDEATYDMILDQIETAETI